jgi:hypothetical protein
MDSFFRSWIPSIKKDIELSSLIINKVAGDLGEVATKLALRATEELRRIPVKYGRLRRKLQKAFARADHDDHAELHKKRVIVSECGKPYTLEEFVELFDHEHNLLLTAEENWTNSFEDEFYEGWPVWANHMKLFDPACGSQKWSLPSEPKDEL